MRDFATRRVLIGIDLDRGRRSGRVVEVGGAVTADPTLEEGTGVAEAESNLQIDGNALLMSRESENPDTTPSEVRTHR